MTDWDITDAMQRFGGGFIQQLGALYRQGDADNRRRIKATWPEYWERYAEIAKLHAEKRAAELAPKTDYEQLALSLSREAARKVCGLITPEMPYGVDPREDQA